MNKKLNAYELGLKGESLPEGTTSTWERWRHQRGMKAMARYAAESFQFHERYKAEFTEVAENAQGLNSKVASILRTAAEIPEPNQLPLKGYELVSEDGSRSKEVLRHFSFSNEPGAETPQFHTPLTRQPGIMHLDSLDWAHYGFTEPVKTISLYLHTPKSAEGLLEADKTTSVIEVNKIPYDPDAIHLDYEDSFTGAVRMNLDATGELAQVERSSSSYTGKVLQKNPLINVAALLEDLHVSVTDTALAYRLEE